MKRRVMRRTVRGKVKRRVMRRGRRRVERRVRKIFQEAEQPAGGEEAALRGGDRGPAPAGDILVGPRGEDCGE